MLLKVDVDNNDAKENGKVVTFVTALNTKFKVVKNQAAAAEDSFETLMSKLKKDIVGKVQLVL